MDRYLLEQLNRDMGFYLRATETLAVAQSPWQKIEIFNSAAFGRGMVIDGCFMTSERDEFFYHENIVHLAGIAHANPESALIVGGGDGGAAEELLKYPGMKRVVLAELDEQVVALARQHLPAIHRGAFDDPRLDVRFIDGKAFIEAASERFDLIVLDLTDPFGPAQALYTADFYAACKRALNPGGALSLHLGSPIHRPRTMNRIVKSLQCAFAIVRPYLVPVPLYGACWAIASASATLDPAALDEAAVDARIAARGLTHLQYYNGAMHRAACALPNFVRELLARDDAPITLDETLDEVVDPAQLPPLAVTRRNAGQ
ncbi:MAG: polyamine aminopropyltransferase [Betaproteobacteria bacterium]|nr:polyamine aminopropyltransferase [Betaproteobacteria bacterium]MCL2886464.1 polyamine aminopropyltransferase [Betaproteobacteria bacterium]